MRKRFEFVKGLDEEHLVFKINIFSMLTWSGMVSELRTISKLILSRNVTELESEIKTRAMWISVDLT